MSEVFGEDIATGQYARGKRRGGGTSSQLTPNFVDVGLEDLGPDEQTTNTDIPTIPISLDNLTYESNVEGSNIGKPSRAENSRGRKRVKTIGVYTESMDVMAANIGRMADAVDRRTSAITLDLATLMQAICEVPDIYPVLVNSTFEFMYGDLVKCQIFMTFDPEARSRWG